MITALLPSLLLEQINIIYNKISYFFAQKITFIFNMLTKEKLMDMIIKFILRCIIRYFVFSVVMP